MKTDNMRAADAEKNTQRHAMKKRRSIGILRH